MEPEHAGGVPVVMAPSLLLCTRPSSRSRSLKSKKKFRKLLNIPASPDDEAPPPAQLDFTASVPRLPCVQLKNCLVIHQ